ncbi:hypothetical protein GLW08_21470 [Pontibacillus yanchengensis]|uniref:Uncharacterized protein n=1 Tax=Pontibacillus yanchengensis TaxID=462910 RepID=A0ACC7VMP2_9BACI|nr:hypothetical protein [Pontibacillus yanchengensis]MYL55874.1 hypothetical protein [Pontibacillus yanchengensis]
MKKSLASLAILSTFVFSYNTSVSADELDTSEGKSQITSKDGEEDGVNDSSTVQTKVTKISDKPIDELFSTQGAGEWDYIGESDFARKSKVFTSGGGDLKIYIYQPYLGPGFQWKYHLKEEDPTFDDTVSSFNLSNEEGTYQVEFNVRSYTDGNNGNAELYLLKDTNPATIVQTEWFD